MKTTTNDTLIIETLQHEPISTSFYPMVSASRYEDQLYVCVCLLLTQNQIDSLDVIEVMHDPIIMSTLPFDRHFNIKVDDENDDNRYPYPFTFNAKNIALAEGIRAESILVTVTTSSDPNYDDDDMNADPKTKRGTEVTVQSSTH